MGSGEDIKEDAVAVTGFVVGVIVIVGSAWGLPPVKVGLGNSQVPGWTPVSNTVIATFTSVLDPDVVTDWIDKPVTVNFAAGAGAAKAVPPINVRPIAIPTPNSDLYRYIINVSLPFCPAESVLKNYAETTSIVREPLMPISSMPSIEHRLEEGIIPWKANWGLGKVKDVSAPVGKGEGSFRVLTLCRRPRN